MSWTLLLRFAGVLQSWGTDSRFEIRRTQLFPTKSGVIGFLAAALGRRRNEKIDDLKNLNIGVRVDRPGTMISDFHTARKDAKTSYITTRYYLADAVFLVGIESNNKEELEQLKEAILHPAFPLYLGRRSCPPELPIYMDLVEQPLEQALKEYKCLLNDEKQAPELFHIYLEGKKAGVEYLLLDDPISFDYHHRQYKPRMVSELVVPNPYKLSQSARMKNLDVEASQIFETDHDAFSIALGMEELS